MKSSLWIVFGGVLTLAVAAGCSGGKGGGTPPPPEPGCNNTMPGGFPLTPTGLEVGNTIPDLTLHDITGNSVCTRGAAGKVLWINQGAGWCPPCRAEVNSIETIYEKYKDQGFEVVMAMIDGYSLNSQPNQTFLNQWNSFYKIQFLTVPDHTAQTYLNYARTDDPNYPGDPATQGIVIPLNVVVDRDQRVAYNLIGGIASEVEMDHLVSALVGSSAHLTYSSTP